MPSMRISELRHNSILRLYAEKDHIQVDPDYQRMGGVWNLDKRQLLMDTILNELDMPKLYFHEFDSPKTSDDGKPAKYAVIDGRQRLESIYGFIEGKFGLAEDFTYFADPQVDARGLTYQDLGKQYPLLKTILDSYSIPVTTVLTDDLDLVEEMFSRLNEAVPLNAAEKRNAKGGVMARVIRDVANHRFFAENVPFSNNRYQYREVAAKFLLLTTNANIGDTKKAYLDQMVDDYHSQDKEDETQAVYQHVTRVLDQANSLFVENDGLLRTQAMTVVYFQVFKDAMSDGWFDNITRQQLSAFEQMRSRNRELAEEDLTQASYDLLEFDRMHMQGSNDKTSIEFRVSTLIQFLKNGEDYFRSK